MNRSVVVSKFGGTSMGDYQAMVRSATISLERKASIVVVSATSGTTDRLIEIAKLAGNGSLSDCEKLVFNLKERHLTLLSQAGSSDDSASLLQGHFTEMDLLIQNISLLKELTPRAHDHILSLGERMSSLIFRDVLRSLAPSKKVTLIDARSIIKTDSNFGKATPQIDLIHQNISQKMPMSADQIYVTQGFIGSDAEGHTTILGRGGSDYSAALFAEGAEATCLEIWTDVAGIATTDPRLCQTAKVIHEISYQEAGEMAQYGAKILHPATISPAVRKSIPVFVGSTFDKEMPGTWIRSSVESRPSVRAITKRGQQSLLTVTTPKMLDAYGFMSEIFGVFGKHRISVDCVTTSEISVAITVDNTTLNNEKFLNDLKNVAKVDIEDGYSLVSLIGNEMFGKSNLAKTIFSTLDETNIRMMGLGASPYNFNFLVKDADATNCISRLHKTLIEDVQ